MATDTKPWERADLARLPDDSNRYEVLDGRLLVTPQASHDHQSVALCFAMALQTYVGRSGVAHVVGPGAVPFGPNELQPDVQVIPGPRRAGQWQDFPSPLLVVEVLSGSSRRHDLGDKLDAYVNRIDVGTVWVVDHALREVHVFERGTAPRVEHLSLEWHAPGAPEPLQIDLAGLFRGAMGE